MSQLKATYKEIWRIGYPLMLGNFAWALIGMFDTIFMGWIPGQHEAEVAQGAIGAISILYSILFMIGFGYTRGTQILIARRMGEGNKHKVSEIIDNTIVVMVASSMILFLSVQFFANEFLSWKMSDKEIIAQVVAARFRIAEIAVPTRYFPEASSASFSASVVYGLKILTLASRFTLYKWKLISGRQFVSLRARYTKMESKAS